MKPDKELVDAIRRLREIDERIKRLERDNLRESDDYQNSRLGRDLRSLSQDRQRRYEAIGTLRAERELLEARKKELTDNAKDDTKETISRSEYENVNRELENSHEIIRHLKRKAKGVHIDHDQLQSLADSCRMKNGRISFRRLAKELGVTHPTAANWCTKERIS